MNDDDLDTDDDGAADELPEVTDPTTIPPDEGDAGT